MVGVVTVDQLGGLQRNDRSLGTSDSNRNFSQLLLSSESRLLVSMFFFLFLFSFCFSTWNVHAKLVSKLAHIAQTKVRRRERGFLNGRLGLGVR